MLILPFGSNQGIGRIATFCVRLFFCAANKHCGCCKTQQQPHDFQFVFHFIIFSPALPHPVERLNTKRKRGAVYHFF